MWNRTFVSTVASAVLTLVAARSIAGAETFTITSHEPGASFAVGVGVTISGKHSLSASNPVWCFCRDATRGYYLQNPPVEILADTWEASNIQPGQGIDTIVFCQVDKVGDERLRKWVEQKRWGKIDEDEIKKLPGFRELARLKVMVK